MRLQDDPVTKCPCADVKRFSGTRGRQDLFRIRIGGFSAVYAVRGDEVLVTDIFPRGRGYDGVGVGVQTLQQPIFPRGRGYDV